MVTHTESPLPYVEASATVRMDASYARPGDVCPICKSTIQSTPNLRFKVAELCYHRICEGCVDRKFVSGRAECPVSTCHKNYWKRDWRYQTFENIKIEQERDERRKVYNRLNITRLGLPDDASAFEDLRAFNDYLELREELVMDMVLEIDKPDRFDKTMRKAALKKLDDFEAANGLRSTTEDDAIARKKRQFQDGEYPDASGLIQGLRRYHVPKPATPYMPFGDIPRDREYYDVGSGTGMETLLREEQQIAKYLPWGYSLEALVDENLLRAFSGLGVFVDAEKSHITSKTIRA